MRCWGLAKHSMAHEIVSYVYKNLLSTCGAWPRLSMGGWKGKPVWVIKIDVWVIIIDVTRLLRLTEQVLCDSFFSSIPVYPEIYQSPECHWENRHWHLKCQPLGSLFSKNGTKIIITREVMVFVKGWKKDFVHFNTYYRCPPYPFIFLCLWIVQQSYSVISADHHTI